MTSPSSRLRITLPAAERGYLHWLAVEAGNDDATEARLLLVMGIRLAMRRYRRLYGGLPIAEADQASIERNTPGEPGNQVPSDYHRLPGHNPIGGFEVDPGLPPLTLPDWAGGHLSNPHRERGFGGHGTEERK